MTTTPPTEGNNEACCEVCGRPDDGNCNCPLLDLPVPAAQAPDEAVEKAVRTADGQTLTAPEVAALDAIKDRIGWASLHWRTDEVSPDAWPHLAIAAARAALSAATPGADEVTIPGCCVDIDGGRWHPVGECPSQRRPSPGVVDLRPGLREALDRMVQPMTPTGSDYPVTAIAYTDVLSALASRPGDDARVVAAEAEVARLRAEAEQHALANDGCVPGAAYRDLAAAHAALREQIETIRAAFHGADYGSLVETLRAVLADTAGAPRTDVSAERPECCQGFVYIETGVEDNAGTKEYAQEPCQHTLHRIAARTDSPAVRPDGVSAEPEVDSPARDDLAERMRRALDEDMRYDDDDWTRLADAALRWFRDRTDSPAGGAHQDPHH